MSTEETKWAVILGASVGTGAASARRLALDPGLHIFGVHRGNHSAAAAEVTRAVEDAGRRAHIVSSDAGNAEAAARLVGEIRRVAGPRSVRVFVHSLASASVGSLSVGARRLSPRQIQRTMDVMANSFVYWAQELVAQDVLAPNARLLGLSNPLTDTVLRETAAIAASKAALEMYVRHLAHELGPLGHRVNLLKFGAISTRAARTTFGEEGWAELERLLKRALPARRLSTLDEVAQLVSLLAGDAAAWMNAATIDFTGGESQSYYQALLDIAHPPQAKNGERRAKGVAQRSQS